MKNESTRIALLLRVLVGAAIAASMVATANAQSTRGTLDKIKKSGTISLGYRENATPFSFTEPGKEPIGYSLDLCREVVSGIRRQLKLADLKIKWVPVTIGDRIKMVVDGNVDLECGSTTNTLSRREVVDFSIPTFIDGGSYIAKAASRLESIKDLDGKRVGMIAGSSTEKAFAAAASRAFAKPVIVFVKDHDEGFQGVRDGKLDAYASDRMILFGLAVTANVDLKDYFLSSELFSYEPYGLMMRRDPEFRLAVDRQLARMYRSGEIIKIVGNWFGALGEPPELLKAMYILNSYPE
ncbi:MAG: amino acid ABC transporter substrate-binding protein [Betaproteobacteria bacterium]|jgi:ABC-type amino acid transport substrate-binding protein|nr:amino acid ABC transporter substrate-binding protein [Betaproteobacteria bacterium]